MDDLRTEILNAIDNCKSDLHEAMNKNKLDIMNEIHKAINANVEKTEENVQHHIQKSDVGASDNYEVSIPP